MSKSVRKYSAAEILPPVATRHVSGGSRRRAAAQQQPVGEQPAKETAGTPERPQRQNLSRMGVSTRAIGRQRSFSEDLPVDGETGGADCRPQPPRTQAASSDASRLSSNGGRSGRNAQDGEAVAGGRRSGLIRRMYRSLCAVVGAVGAHSSRVQPEGSCKCSIPAPASKPWKRRTQPGGSVTSSPSRNVRGDSVPQRPAESGAARLASTDNIALPRQGAGPVVVRANSARRNLSFDTHHLHAPAFLSAPSTAPCETEQAGFAMERWLDANDCVAGDLAGPAAEEAADEVPSGDVFSQGDSLPDVSSEVSLSDDESVSPGIVPDNATKSASSGAPA